MKPAEIEALIAACRTSKNLLLADVVLVAVHTGPPAVGADGTLVGGIDLTRDVITPKASRTSGKSRVVPINADV
jgi:hypothetical protein